MSHLWGFSLCRLRSALRVQQDMNCSATPNHEAMPRVSAGISAFHTQQQLLTHVRQCDHIAWQEHPPLQLCPCNVLHAAHVILLCAIFEVFSILKEIKVHNIQLLEAHQSTRMTSSKSLCSADTWGHACPCPHACMC